MEIGISIAAEYIYDNELNDEEFEKALCEHEKWLEDPESGKQTHFNKLCLKKKDFNQVPLTPELIQLISRTRMGYVIYGFDSEDRMICAFDSQERMYTFEYEKNKIWIVRSFVPHPPQQKQDLLDQVFEDIYEEKHQGPELLTVAECEYDDKGRIVKYIETHFVEGDEKYRKGIIRFFEYNSYHYDNQGISEHINYWLRVHLRRKNHIIPAEILSEESLFKNPFELEKRLQRAGFSYSGGKHRFIHDEEGYITQYITSTREKNYRKT